MLIRRFADQILSSRRVSLTESSQHLDVISEAMLRLGSLMRTNHMLGGKLSDLEPHQCSAAHMCVRPASDTLFEELSLAIAQVSAEMAIEGSEGSAEV